MLQADLVMTNAVVRSMDPERSVHQAVAVRDGRVLAVGSNAEIDVLNGPETTVIDCAGSALLPGFVDGHCHFEMTCLAIDHGLKVQTPPYRTLAEVRRAIEDRLHEVSGDEWIICRSSFDMHEKVVEKRLFSREELDEICADRPMVVFASLHVSSMNTKAFEVLGLMRAESVHAQAGFVHRDASGRPTGVVTEIFLLLPEIWGEEEFRAAVSGRSRDHFNAAGTTTVYSMPESLAQLDYLKRMHEESLVSLRQRYFLIHPAVADFETVLEHARRGDLHENLTFGGMKIFVNGCAHDGVGTQLDDSKWTQEELSLIVSRAHEAGIQTWLHSLDNNGVRMAARAIQSARETGDPAMRSLRHRIEHGADFVCLDDLELVKDSGALLVTTPQFLRSMTRGVTATFAPLNTLRRSGIGLVGGTDSTGTVPSSISILGNVETALTRRNARGEVLGQGEALDVAAAFELFTSGASYGGYEEDQKGVIAPGFLADVVQLSMDPWEVSAEEFSTIRVVRTILGGQVVFP